MAMVYACGGGLAGHAKTVGAGLLTQGQQERRTFSPMPDDVLRVADW